MTDHPPLVRVDGLVKTYREGGFESTVLRGASLELRRGETTSLVGASGSGKSTLLALMAGLTSPDAGTIMFDGADVGHLEEAGRARLRGTRIGVVLQTGTLVPFLTAAENVELAIQLSGGPRGRTTRDLLVELGLADRLDHRPARLSGGEAQRVSIAMALAKQPDLLLADEVTGELDASTASQVMTIIFEAARVRGLTVLFVTHDRELAERAQHRLRLANGQVGAA